MTEDDAASGFLNMLNIIFNSVQGPCCDAREETRNQTERKVLRWKQAPEGDEESDSERGENGGLHA